MQVTIKLYASLAAGRFRTESRDFPPGTGIGDIAAALGIPADQLGIVLRNGTHAGIEQLVAEGDTISLLPLIGGG
jgi:molybdopterin converting factor small subunit